MLELQQRPLVQSLPLSHFTSQLAPARHFAPPAQAPAPQVSSVCVASLVICVPQVWLWVQLSLQSSVSLVQLTCPHAFTDVHWMSQVFALQTTEFAQALVPVQFTLQ